MLKEFCMNCCQKELKELIQIYEARIGRTDKFLVELDLKGRNKSITYKINDKLVLLLEQIVKDLKEISDKKDHEEENENQHKSSSAKNAKK